MRPRIHQDRSEQRAQALAECYPMRHDTVHVDAAEYSHQKALVRANNNAPNTPSHLPHEPQLVTCDGE